MHNPCYHSCHRSTNALLKINHITHVLTLTQIKCPTEANPKDFFRTRAIPCRNGRDYVFLVRVRMEVWANLCVPRAKVDLLGYVRHCRCGWIPLGFPTLTDSPHFPCPTLSLPSHIPCPPQFIRIKEFHGVRFDGSVKIKVCECMCVSVCVDTIQTPAKGVDITSITPYGAVVTPCDG